MSAAKEPQENSKDAESDSEGDKKDNEGGDKEPIEGKPIKRKHTLSQHKKG
jgi:hypothetical protein